MGDKNPSKKKEVREKIRDTAINNYLNSKPINTFVKGNKKTFFSGTTLYYQGSYELDFLKNFYGRFNIENGKVFKYIDGNGSERLYVSDFYLPEYNLIVEVKSTYTLLKSKGAVNNKFKEKQVLNEGYNFIFLIDKDYNEFHQNIYNC